MTDSTNDPVLDEGVLETLRALGGDDDPELFNEVIALYLDDAAQHVVTLRSAIEQHDVRLLERTAHTLKSSSANVGAMTFSKLCLELEQAARETRLESTPSLVEAAERQFSLVRDALRTVRG